MFLNAKNKKILITGSAGFIGFHFTLRLLKEGFSVVSIDNVNDYYDVKLKNIRLDILKQFPNFTFYKENIQDKAIIKQIFEKHHPNSVVHLAAQAGVRYSLENPQEYIDSNVMGFMNILEGARACECEHLLYASSSSVYGGNTKFPWSPEDQINHPSSIYAATKRANELMAHSYSHLFKIPTTGMRFFTAYGPYGRPDMALFIFADAILNNKPVRLFNKGEMVRDITYIDDVVEAITRLMPLPPQGNNNAGSRPDSSIEPFRIVNIGNQNPAKITVILAALEKALGKKANVILDEMQLGDVKMSHSDCASLNDIIGFVPQTSIDEGIGKFAKWYKDYNKF